MEPRKTRLRADPGHMLKTGAILLPLLAAFVLSILTGCATTPETILDIRILPQSNTRYLEPASADRELVTPEQQQTLEAEYRSHFLAPWFRERPEYGKSEMERDFRKFQKEPGYGENNRKHDAAWVEKLAANADIEDYPNSFLRAITIADSDLRLLPTRKPHFSALHKEGSSYPFDNVQNSLAPANTPVLVTHISRDKAWLFVESHVGCGWIPAENAARVDGPTVEIWERSPYAALIGEEVPVYGENDLFLFKAFIGMHFPVVGEDSDSFRILVARADENREVRIVRARLPKTSAALRPLTLTQARIATIADELINQPYGWGGMYRNRDCSAMLQDLFAPFGFRLPRHSSDQAMHGGKFLSLAGIPTPEKERLIREKGIPYFTLLWVKGHVMLYIGCRDGRPLIFHNVWGVRTRSFTGTEGRFVIGRAVITTLHPGVELTNKDTSTGDLADKIEGMTLLGPH